MEAEVRSILVKAFAPKDGPGNYEVFIRLAEAVSELCKRPEFDQLELDVVARGW